MSRIITYEIAMAAGLDAANKQMKTAGRAAWNEDDFNRAASITRRLLDIMRGDTGVDANDRDQDPLAERLRASELPGERQAEREARVVLGVLLNEAADALDLAREAMERSRIYIETCAAPATLALLDAALKVMEDGA